MTSNNLAPLQIENRRILRLKGEQDQNLTAQPADSDISIQDKLSHLLPRKYRLFVTVNLLLIALVTTALVTNRYSQISMGIYIIILFFICTTPLLFIRTYKGRSSILLVFLAYYFAVFALKDIQSIYIIDHDIGTSYKTWAFLTPGEIAIIIGAICVILGYAIGVLLFSNKKSSLFDKEWSPKTIAITGLIFWSIGFYVVAVWQFGVADKFSGQTVNSNIGGFITLLRMLHPMGSLLLIYLFLTTRNKTALILLLGTFCFDFILGVFGDSKEIYMRAPVLYIFSSLMIKEKLPIIETILFTLAVGIAFNISSVYRMDVHSSHKSRDYAVQNFEDKIDKLTNQDKSLSERFQHGMNFFIDRVALKHHVELIVKETGKSVDYMDGHTIEPLLYVFIPRLIMPDKGDSSQAGKLYNQHFKISNSTDTFISMSQLGELYWNFGWTGIILGMSIIGIIMGSLASLMRLDKKPTLSKFLILLITTYLLALRFEGAIAKTYVVWLRTTLFFFLIQLFINKQKK